MVSSNVVVCSAKCQHFEDKLEDLNNLIEKVKDTLNTLGLHAPCSPKPNGTEENKIEKNQSEPQPEPESTTSKEPQRAKSPKKKGKACNCKPKKEDKPSEVANEQTPPKIMEDHEPVSVQIENNEATKEPAEEIQVTFQNICKCPQTTPIIVKIETTDNKSDCVTKDELLHILREERSQSSPAIKTPQNSMESPVKRKPPKENEQDHRQLEATSESVAILQKKLKTISSVDSDDDVPKDVAGNDEDRQAAAATGKRSERRVSLDLSEISYIHSETEENRFEVEPKSISDQMLKAGSNVHMLAQQSMLPNTMPARFVESSSTGSSSTVSRPNSVHKPKLAVQTIPAINIPGSLVVQKTLALSIKPTGSVSHEPTLGHSNVAYEEINAASSNESIKVNASKSKEETESHNLKFKKNDQYTPIVDSQALSVFKSFQILEGSSYTLRTISKNHEPEEGFIVNRSLRAPWDIGFYRTVETQCDNVDVFNVEPTDKVMHGSGAKIRTPVRKKYGSSSSGPLREEETASTSSFADNFHLVAERPVKDTSVRALVKEAKRKSKDSGVLSPKAHKAEVSSISLSGASDEVETRLSVTNVVPSPQKSTSSTSVVVGSSSSSENSGSSSDSVPPVAMDQAKFSPFTNSDSDVVSPKTKELRNGKDLAKLREMSKEVVPSQRKTKDPDEDESEYVETDEKDVQVSLSSTSSDELEEEPERLDETVTNFIKGLTGTSEEDIAKIRQSSSFLDDKARSQEKSLAKITKELSETSEQSRRPTFERSRFDALQVTEERGDISDRLSIKQHLPFYRRMLGRKGDKPMQKSKSAALPFDDSVSEGEIKYRNSFSVGEVLPFKDVKRTERLNWTKVRRCPEETAFSRRDSKSSKLARQRAQYNEWITSCLKDKNDSFVDSTSSSACSHSLFRS